jgi:hypothetical protein
MLIVERPEGGFLLGIGSEILLRHAPDERFLFAGHGRADVTMRRGNFAISDRLDDREPLRALEHQGDALVLRRHPGDAPQLVLRLVHAPDHVRLERVHAAAGLNRFWVRVRAKPGEAVCAPDAAVRAALP